MSDIINLLITNGVGVVCIAYFIYNHSTTMKDLTKAVDSMVDSVNNFNTRLTIIEEKIERSRKNEDK